jgi:hypothetical protein
VTEYKKGVDVLTAVKLYCDYYCAVHLSFGCEADAGLLRQVLSLVRLFGGHKATKANRRFFKGLLWQSNKVNLTHNQVIIGKTSPFIDYAILFRVEHVITRP